MTCCQVLDQCGFAAGLRIVRTAIFAGSVLYGAPPSSPSCIGLFMCSGAFLLNVLTFSGQACLLLDLCLLVSVASAMICM